MSSIDNVLVDSAHAKISYYKSCSRDTASAMVYNGFVQLRHGFSNFWLGEFPHLERTLIEPVCSRFLIETKKTRAETRTYSARIGFNNIPHPFRYF